MVKATQMFLQCRENRRTSRVLASMGETCFVCSSLIREASTEHEGEPALLCEGRHKRWAHARCVGVSDALYADIQTCETPWLCTECYNEAAKAVQNLPLLQEEIESLKAENTGVKEEIGELKALVASLHAALSAVENRLKSVSSHVDLLQSVPAEEVSAETPSQLEPTSAEQAPRSSYSDVTCSNTTNGQRGSANRGHTRRRGAGRRGPPSRLDRGQARPPSNQAGLPNSTTTSTVATSPNGGEKIPVLGKRRVWGTLKACSQTTVKHALDQLVPALKGKLQVKRKYKKLRDNRIRWWHVISGAEKDLEDLQKSWEVVHIQTRWKIEACLMDADKDFLEQASSQQPPT